MNAQRCLLVVVPTLGLLLGCSGEPPETEPLGRTQQALNVCDETVPDEHYVDGIPAYAQCDETTGEIWSNNGVDTSATSLGSDWVRTQRSGGYQCTEYAYRYLYFRWDIDYRGGNGGEWCDGDLPDTLLANSAPVHGDVVVFAPGSCGADPVYGHVAVVDTVNEAEAEVTFVEQNRANRRTCAIDTANCFLHAVANDGQTGTGGAGGEGGTSGGGGSGGSLVPACDPGLTLCGQECVDTNTDPDHCGGCEVACALPGAVTECVGGICTLSSCQPGAVDLDQDPTNGCEYACTATGAEACNGLDDDCNGVVDDDPVCTGAGGTSGVGGTPGVGGAASGGSPGVGGSGADVPISLGGAPSGGAAPVGSGGSDLETGGSDPGTGGTNAPSSLGGAQTGGAAPTGGSDPGDSDSGSEESGCGCMVPGTSRRAPSPVVMLLGALLLLRHRRGCRRV